MEYEDILKGNELIADFMGLQWIGGSDISGYRFPYPIVIDLKENQNHYFKLNELRYRHSWNWLIPVVTKCHLVEMKDGWSKADRIESCIPSNSFVRGDVGAVYESVVEFIKWYNKKKV